MTPDEEGTSGVSAGPFPFIVGCNRSGTTMLRAMLDSHPEVAVPPEAYFVIPVLNRAPAYERGDQLDLETLLADLRSNPSFRRNWQLSSESMAALRKDGGPADTAAALARLYSGYATERHKLRYADKTPQHVLQIDLLARSFPGSRFVHLVRDGRDVVPSLLEGRHGPTRFPGAVEYWRSRVLAGRRAGERLGPSRYHEIRYEELVADPEAKLAQMCAFLDLRYTPEMLEYPARAGEVVAGTFDARPHLGVAKAPTRNVRNWRTTMPDHQVQLFEALAGDALDTFGYERSAMAPSSRVRIEVVIRRAATAASASARKLRRAARPTRLGS
jgi:hypothetical protein